MTELTERRLLAWLHDPSERRGIRFARDADEWELWPYARLAGLAGRVGCGLVECGVRENDVVSIVQRPGPEFVASFFGTLLAGATPSPVAPPIAFQDPVAYADHVAGLLGSARPALVLADRERLQDLAEIAERAGAVSTSVELLLDRVDEAERSPDRKPPEHALLQFTSGSSGRSRGVRIPFDALETNVQAIRRWLQMTESDPTATWLPIHHDMGLIGCLLTPIANRSDLWVLEPEEFVRRPLRYLRCFGISGARLTAMPTFGLDYVVRRVSAADLEGCDFSELRAVIVGAERIDAESLERFGQLLAPFGLDRRAFLPAYGLAEATLAATGLPLEETWSSLRLEPKSLAMGRRAERVAEGEGQVLVGCGRPLAGVRVDVEDDRGRLVEDGNVGEIVVRGASVAAGYAVAVDSPSLTTLSDGTLRSGDAGFVVDGQLFVLGRLGDSLKIRGRAIFAEDLEFAIGAAGVPRRRVAALLGVREGTPIAVALLEQPRAAWLELARAALRPRVEGAEIVLVEAPKGTIVRTSSGKPRRRVLWDDFVAGRLAGARATRGAEDAS